MSNNDCLMIGQTAYFNDVFSDGFGFWREGTVVDYTESQVCMKYVHISEDLMTVVNRDRVKSERPVPENVTKLKGVIQSVCEALNADCANNYFCTTLAEQIHGEGWKMSEQCYICWRNYEAIYWCPDHVWEKIKPDSSNFGGLLCIECAHQRAINHGHTLRFTGSDNWWANNEEHWKYSIKEIPPITVKNNWKIQLKPASGVATIRFGVELPDGRIKSVFLDAYGDAHWDVYPVYGDADRCCMDDTQMLVQLIEAPSDEADNDN